MRKHAPLASLAGGLMTMAGVICLMFALWRLTSDLGWTDTFAIQNGLLSHWQVWIGLTFGAGYLALRLIQFGKIDERAVVLDAPGPETAAVSERVSG